MPLSVFHRLQKENPSCIMHYNPTQTSVKVANGSSVPTFGSFKPSFSIAKETFSETFLLLKTMNQTLLVLPFFEKNGTSIHPKSRTHRLPNMTLQLTERMHTDGKISSLTSKKNQFLRNTSSFSVNPNTNQVITCSLPHHSYPDNTVAIVEPLC